jgi:hypothetical protein
MRASTTSGGGRAGADGLDEGGRVRTDASDVFDRVTIEVASALSARLKTPHSSIPEGVNGSSGSVSETLPLLRTRSKVCAIFFPGGAAVRRSLERTSQRERGGGSGGVRRLERCGGCHREPSRESWVVTSNSGRSRLARLRLCGRAPHIMDCTSARGGGMHRSVENAPWWTRIISSYADVMSTPCVAPAAALPVAQHVKQPSSRRRRLCADTVQTCTLLVRCPVNPSQTTCTVVQPRPRTARAGRQQAALGNIQLKCDC